MNTKLEDLSTFKFILESLSIPPGAILSLNTGPLPSMSYSQAAHGKLGEGRQAYNL